MLKGKHIILGITGGIAAYKSAILARLLVKAGAEVQVVMTPSAKEFITPLTLSTLTGKPVISEFFTANTGEWNSHVDLGLWADAMVVAPATACTLGKMAFGIADNMLITTYLSIKAPVFVAPAMDLDMMAHPATTLNLNMLQSHGVHVIEAQSGELASHLEGKGRMEEPERIVEVLHNHFAKKLDLLGKNVLITAGPTYEMIDPVRFIGNFSSGKMGFALAEQAASRGAKVTVVTGPVNLTLNHPSVTIYNVTSALDMREYVIQCMTHTNFDMFILAAAVSDYRPEEYYEEKIKREEDEMPVIKLVPNRDIARFIGEVKQPDQLAVGFALETQNERDNAVDKMRRKKLDVIVLNSLRTQGAGFGTDTNRVTIFCQDHSIIEGELKSKKDVADDILDVAVAQLAKKRKRLAAQQKKEAAAAADSAKATGKGKK